MGHLYNGRYLEYFMNAREDHLLNEYDMDLYAYTAETGNTWMVVQNQISYFREARLMEEVVISSRLLKMDDIKATAEMIMFDSKKSHIKSLLWVTFIHFNVRTKSVGPLSEEMKSIFLDLLDTVEESSFDMRSERLRKLGLKAL
jgi:acyl-CoA thioester hydrolase